MANYYNINRSIETYELRLIDPNDGQLKNIFDISSIGGGGVQPSDVYTKSEVDTLLSGDLTVSSLQSTNNIQTSSTIRTNTFNVGSLNTKISFYDDTTEYMKYENSTVDATFNGLKVLDNLYTMDIYPQSIKLPYNNKIAFIDTDGTGDDYYNQNYINITIDGGIQRLNHVITSGNEHRFYVGDIATASDGDLVMKLSNTRIDIYKDLYLNDTLFSQGGGSGNPFDENVVINNPYELQCNTFNNNGLNQDVVFNINSNEWFRLQFSDNTVRVPNTKSFLSQNFYTDIIRPIAFGNDMVCYGSNAADSGYVEYWKLNHSAETIDFSKVIRCNELNTLTDTDLIIKRYGVEKMSVRSTYTEFSGGVHCGNQLVVDTSKLLTLAPYAFGGYNYFDIRNNHGTNLMIRFRCSVSGETVCMEITPSYVNLKKDLTIENTVRLKTNTIDTNGDNDLVFKRIDVQHMLFSSDKVEMTQLCHFNGSWVLDTADLISCSYRVEGSLKLCDFRNDVADGVVGYRFLAKGSSAGDVLLYITSNSIDASRDIQISASYGLYANKVSSKGNNDLVFHRNDVEYMRLSLTNKIITVANDAGLSSPDLFANEFLNRTRQYDTVFWGSHPTADSRVEYMRYNYAGESLDFNCPIDNTGLLITGNIVDTTVQMKDLKLILKMLNVILQSVLKMLKSKHLNIQMKNIKRMINMDLSPSNYKKIYQKNLNIL